MPRNHVATLRLLSILTGLLLLAGTACKSAGNKPMETVNKGWKEVGVASWYGADFHGRRTANGEIYDMYGMTAAHKQLPFDTLVEVENLDNGKKVKVRINDRGPFIRGRIIDLTYTAADKIKMIGPGTAKVRVRVLGAADVPDRRFTIQVGSFSSAATARELKSRLKGPYPDVRVESAAGKHRVLVGSFKKKEQADKLAQKLRRDGYEAFVRTDTKPD